MTAGQGTRLLPFTQKCAKPLLPILGDPIVSLIVENLSEYFKEPQLLFNLHHLSNDTQVKLENVLTQFQSTFSFQDESNLLLDAAGGLRQAANYYQSEFFWINGDTIFPFNALAMKHHYEELRRKFGITLCMYLKIPKGNTTPYRELQYDSRSLLTKIGDLNLNSPYFAGAAIVHPYATRFTPKKGASPFIKDMLEPLVQRGEVGVFVGDDFWVDIGDPSLWAESHRQLYRYYESAEKSKLNRAYSNARLRFFNKHTVVTGQGLVVAHKGFGWSTHQLQEILSHVPEGGFVYLGLQDKGSWDRKDLIQGVMNTVVNTQTSILYLDDQIVFENFPKDNKYQERLYYQGLYSNKKCA